MGGEARLNDVCTSLSSPPIALPPQESEAPVRVPHRTAALLIAAHPGAARERAGHEAELALHHAVSHGGVAPRVLSLLLEANPEGACNGEGEDEIYRVLSLLLEANPEGAYSGRGEKRYTLASLLSRG